MRSSFGDHNNDPGRLLLNETTPPWTRKELKKMGYRLEYRSRTSGPINAVFFDWKDVTGDLWMVRSQKDAPEHAAVAVQYRGYWFYIQENDLESKNTFILLSQLFSLQSGNTHSAAPLLTLPIGN